MLVTAMTLALLTTIGFLAIYLKLPRNIRKFILKHALITDISTLLGIYILLGGTLTALLAAAMCGLSVSLLLYITKNKEHFIYLEDLCEIILNNFKKIEEKIEQSVRGYKLKHGG